MEFAEVFGKAVKILGHHEDALNEEFTGRIGFVTSMREMDDEINFYRVTFPDNGGIDESFTIEQLEFMN